jgi:hypothetical protein
MRKVRGSRALLALAAVAIGAAATLLTACGGKAHLVTTEPEIDYGLIPYREKRIGKVGLRNDGNREVLVGIVSANCSCFTVKPGYSHRLLPGDTTTIEVQIDTSLVPPETIRGKKLMIPSDDPAAGLIEIPLKGDIVLFQHLDPPVVELGALTASALEGPVEKVVRLRPGPGFTVTLVRAQAEPAEWFDLQRTDTEGGADLKLVLKPGARGTGHLRGAIEVVTEVEGAGFPRRRVEDRVVVQGTWP